MKQISILFLLVTTTLFSEIGYVEPWGKDAQMVSHHSALPQMPQKAGFMTRMALQVILFRQKVLSPADGPRSHFRPSSSQYMLLAMKEHGLFKGYIMGCGKIKRSGSIAPQSIMDKSISGIPRALQRKEDLLLGKRVPDGCFVSFAAFSL